VKHFLIDKNYGTYLTNMGMSVDEVLRKAILPQDLFSRQSPSLTAEEYFRFMNAIDVLSENPKTPIILASAEGIETFSPPIFASYCSKNSLACVKRLAQYKPLIGALIYNVEENENEVTVEILSSDKELKLPEILIGIEFVFITHLIRKATKENIIPIKVTTTEKFHNNSYEEFIGTPIVITDRNTITFSKEDAPKPFISYNESMWEFFEPELRRRLSMMETDDTYSAKVRSALMELLPTGECTIDDVARKLGYSKRTLQRNLQKEETSFQKQLNHTRELLAKTYLANTDMTTEDIAFLLGYQEITSFIRAFTVWTGKTVSEYRLENKV